MNTLQPDHTGPACPDWVPRDVWTAYGENYPGGGVRWWKRYSEYRGSSLDPARERPAPPSPPIPLVNYATERKRRAKALRARVDAMVLDRAAS
ncbi:hypothetical protein [Enemella sp. A6]|uniref:hypothetical protein n=1 Tax=Enemella sp. A6 TaxID=3440152 RepID=UPI003EB7D0DF